MKDIIYIKDLRVKTIIGIFDWERETKQEVSIDIESVSYTHLRAHET